MTGGVQVRVLASFIAAFAVGCIADFPPELVERKDSSVPRDAARREGSVEDAPRDAPRDALGDGTKDAPGDTKGLDKTPSDKTPPPLDKTPPPPDKAVLTDTPPPTCPLVCDSCTGGVCNITRGANTTAVPTCPPKMPCKVICQGDKACENGVDCSKATDCDITCDAASGVDACKNAMVKCGSGYCKVSCTGKDTCNKGIDCYTSCGCQIYCKGAQACTTKICPSSPTCCVPASVCQCP